MEMRYALIGVLMTLFTATTAVAEVRVNIGINLPTYPRLVAVPGYPVYYAPGVNSNYFFYDGLYWVFDGEEWLSSSWYNGPWHVVDPDYVPLYVLQVPVRYYRHPPAYFTGWRADYSPRWGERWGRDWEHRHDGWDRRDRGRREMAAPLPKYQRQYSGERYPQAEEQARLHSNNYGYQPRDNVVRDQYQQQRMQQAQPQRDDRGQARVYQQQAQPQRDDRGQARTYQQQGAQQAQPQREERGQAQGSNPAQRGDQGQSRGSDNR
jgi:hypothetical protein